MISWQPMTLFELLTLITSTAGFITVIVSLAFLLRQTREMVKQTQFVAESLRSNAYGVIAEQVFEVDRIFVENPGLRPYFYSGQDISEDDPNYNKVVAVAEYLLDYFESALLQLDLFPQVWPRSVWEAYTVDSFMNSPILRRYWRSRQGWYAEEIKDLVHAGEAKLRSLEQLQEKSTTEAGTMAEGSNEAA